VVTVSLAPIGDRGKFENINLALRDFDRNAIDWLIVVDDDVALPCNFLDRFLFVSEAVSLSIAQPAHRFRSHTSFELTQRVWNSLARTTRFVEIGPLTAFHRDVFVHVMPFQTTRWSFGLDVIWSEIALRKGFRMGVVDATPIAHLRRVGRGYDADAALREGQELLKRFGIGLGRQEILKATRVLTHL